jgi:hypothetical protein
MLNKELLLRDFADKSDSLFNLNVLSTDSFTGEIGEYIACKAFNLIRSARVTKAFDAFSKTNKKYQIKAKVVSKNFDYNLKGLNESLFDYLVIVYFDKYYTPLKLIRIPSSKIVNGKIAISRNTMDAFDQVDISKLTVPKEVRKAIREFAESYIALVDNGIIRSRRIVGDIGEYYAASRLGLILSENKNEQGIDAKHSSGLTFEIKTRRVYESGRRVGKTRRLNNLVGKSADCLIVVTLDRTFMCSGMWVMPMDNIQNKKSASLSIVNRTPGTLNLISSDISWLETGQKFISIKQLQASVSKKMKLTELNHNNDLRNTIPQDYSQTAMEQEFLRRQADSDLLVNAIVYTAFVILSILILIVALFS